MKSNITLIGMPGAGKSTVGIILAKLMSFGFIDTDVLIQINNQKSLQQIMDETGYLNLRSIEEREVLKLNIDRHIIATGGSVVYSDPAMKHLENISDIVFLEADFETVKMRINNFDSRGIAKAEDQSFLDVFNERDTLYRQYAEYIIDVSVNDQDTIAEEIKKLFCL